VPPLLDIPKSDIHIVRSALGQESGASGRQLVPISQVGCRAVGPQSELSVNGPASYPPNASGLSNSFLSSSFAASSALCIGSF
jgi:hypothetical protein